ncbi:MAG: hypothetical protein ACI9K8_001741, partial [Reinekea sp.]
MVLAGDQIVGYRPTAALERTDHTGALEAAIASGVFVQILLMVGFCIIKALRRAQLGTNLPQGVGR